MDATDSDQVWLSAFVESGQKHRDPLPDEYERIFTTRFPQTPHYGSGALILYPDLNLAIQDFNSGVEGFLGRGSLCALWMSAGRFGTDLPVTATVGIPVAIQAID